MRDIYFDWLAHELATLEKEIEIMQKISNDNRARYSHFLGVHAECIRLNEKCDEQPWEKPLDNLTMLYLEANIKEKREECRGLYRKYYNTLREKIRKKEEPFYSIAEQLWIENGGGPENRMGNE